MPDSLPAHDAATSGDPAAEPTLTLTHLFDAPPALVWRAWTDPAHLARWWAPAGCRSEVERFELRPGGAFHLEMQLPDGGVMPCRGTFLEIDPPRRLVYEGPAESLSPCGAGLPPRARVTVTLAEEAGKTRLTLHTRFASADDREAALQSGYATGWAKTLAGIEALLAGEERRP